MDRGTREGTREWTGPALAGLGSASRRPARHRDDSTQPFGVRPRIRHHAAGTAIAERPAVERLLMRAAGASMCMASRRGPTGGSMHRLPAAAGAERALRALAAALILAGT